MSVAVWKREVEAKAEREDKNDKNHSLKCGKFTIKYAHILLKTHLKNDDELNVWQWILHLFSRKTKEKHLQKVFCWDET